jgi:hypothetical protein
MVRRILRGFSTALLTFALGVVLSPMRFHVDFLAHGYVLDGGGGFSITGFTSSYFVKVFFVHRGYPTADKANQVFEDEVRNAAKVIERTPKFDSNGDKIGERALAILLNPENKKQYASVFWTDGRIVTSIDSTSLTHVLEFEKNRER